MPSLIRFLFVVAVLGGCVGGGLYLLQSHFEPESKEVSKVVPGVKIRKQ